MGCRVAIGGGMDIRRRGVVLCFAHGLQKRGGTLARSQARRLLGTAFGNRRQQPLFFVNQDRRWCRWVWIRIASSSATSTDAGSGGGIG